MYFVVFSLCCTWNSCWAIFGSNQNCNVQIENHQAEVMARLEKQNKFNLNNWSHVAKLVIIGILSIFMIIVFYYIRIQLWKSLKNTYTQN